MSEEYNEYYACGYTDATMAICPGFEKEIADLKARKAHLIATIEALAGHADNLEAKLVFVLNFCHDGMTGSEEKMLRKALSDYRNFK